MESAAKTRLIPSEGLHEIYRVVAAAHGADAEEQASFADGLLRADLRGHATQGVGLLSYLDELFEAGTMQFGGALDIVRESASTALLDGNRNSGHVVGKRAMATAIKKAQATGVGFVTVRNSGDCGMLSNYSIQAVESGMIGLAMSTGPILVAPWGGRDAQFCTNPLSLAVPAGEREPIVIDMATSAQSMGHVVLAARDGVRLAGKTVVDRSGVYTDDPARVILDALDRESRMAGALLPEGPKGFGMMLMVEILSALLSGERDWKEAGESGASAGSDRTDTKRARSAYYAQCFLALSVEHFQPAADFLAASDRMIATLTSLPPAEGFASVRLHGQGARERERSYRQGGVPVRTEEWAMVERLLDRRSPGGARALLELAQ
jgi:LDH2 family malate/lactate/ureidoglycolate dehydrogenase